MSEAVDQGYTTNIQWRHKKFNVRGEEEADAVILTEKEINRLYRHDLSDNPRVEQVRDLFIFGCPDWSALLPASRRYGREISWRSEGRYS